VEGVQAIVVQADGPWLEGPELLDGADGAVLYLSEGAKWLQQDPERLAAFQRLAERGGGLAVVHWGMGTKDARYIDGFARLFGGVHGGPDRKFKVGEFAVQIADVTHPIARGLGPFDVREEFYYKIKFAKPVEDITPIARVPIEGASETVAWAWERPERGRSFGFTGGHFHSNWELPEYRRLVAQGILWTLDVPIPAKGLNVDVGKDALELKQRPKN
jgi:type 1 glutamine amidotransferase